jgi:hypothetical protein
MKFLRGRRMSLLSWLAHQGWGTTMQSLSSQLISPQCSYALQLLSNRPYVYCGDQRITWEGVSRFMKLRNIKSKDEYFPTVLPLMGMVAVIVTRRNAAGVVPLGSLLLWSTASKCSDPRDRVFALLALASPNSKGEVLKADYSKLNSRYTKLYYDTS